MSNYHRPKLLLLGTGEECDRWAAALSAVADVRRNREADWGGLDGLVLARGALDPFSCAKEALLAGRAVLYASPFLLTPWQAGILARLSRRQGTTLRFVEPFREQQAVAFLRRLFEGREPLWQPLYLRMVRLARAGTARIDELATQELAVSDALLGRVPEWVQATAARGREAGEVIAVFLTVHYAEGPDVQCTVSLAEGRSERTLVAATRDRTIVLDDLDSLQIGRHGAEDANAVEQLQLPVDPCWANGVSGAIEAEARCFVEGLLGAAPSLSNAERWERIAGMWWAARQSMSFGGPIEVPRAMRAHTGPPPLQVIKGGGKRSRAGRRPALTLVAG